MILLWRTPGQNFFNCLLYYFQLYLIHYCSFSLLLLNTCFNNYRREAWTAPVIAVELKCSAPPNNHTKQHKSVEILSNFQNVMFPCADVKPFHLSLSGDGSRLNLTSFRVTISLPFNFYVAVWNMRIVNQVVAQIGVRFTWRVLFVCEIFTAVVSEAQRGPHVRHYTYMQCVCFFLAQIRKNRCETCETCWPYILWNILTVAFSGVLPVEINNLVPASQHTISTITCHWTLLRRKQQLSAEIVGHSSNDLEFFIDRTFGASTSSFPAKLKLNNAVSFFPGNSGRGD